MSRVTEVPPKFRTYFPGPKRLAETFFTLVSDTKVRPAGRLTRRYLLIIRRRWFLIDSIGLPRESWQPYQHSSRRVTTSFLNFHSKEIITGRRDRSSPDFCNCRQGLLVGLIKWRVRFGEATIRGGGQSSPSIRLSRIKWNSFRDGPFLWNYAVFGSFLVHFIRLRKHKVEYWKTLCW